MTQNIHATVAPESSRTMFRNFNDMVTVTELADMLKVGRNTAYELVRAGTVPSIKIGRQMRVSKQSVIDYISRAEIKLG